ncbi:MAG TPA: DUF2794 domain-containing protein [Kiloniellales bacterium]|nr:DUF2794 domain-containing protein [Kiloniellales bacterium]
MDPQYPFDDLRSQTKATFFDRSELSQILSVYSRRVANGEWRDYAIDQRAGSAVFSVFRHSHDAPAFRIAKRRSGGERVYVVVSGRETLARAETLREALAVFGGPLRVVS